MKDWRRWFARFAAAGVLGLVAWWVSQPAADAYTSIQGEAFATHYRITYADGPSAETLRQAVDQELARIDALASTWRADSELMRYNRAVSPGDFDLSPALAGLMARAEEIEVKTSGAFSPRPDGGLIDLSGIAKGYAVDRVTELMQNEFGITDCLVDIGGEVKAIGNGRGGDGWRVGLYVPTDSLDTEVPVIRLQDMSVATSGNYFKGDHILDPRTAQPVENELLSASVIHPSNTAADALATALFVMGPERGMAWAKAHAVQAILILKDGTRLENNALDFHISDY